MGTFQFEKIADGYENGELVKYTLMDPDLYFDTAYRILRKKESSNFIMAHKVRCNGKIQFLYNVSGFRSLSEVAGRYQVREYMHLINRLLKECNEISEMGFIQLETIDTALNRIWLDEKSGQIKFICLPVALDKSQELCRDFGERITETAAQLIENSGYSRDRVLANVYRACMDHNFFGGRKHENNRKTMTLTCVSHKMEPVSVFKNEFILGKGTQADGVVLVSSAVSRKHCRILMDATGERIEDLNSLNGTYVNGERLADNRQYRVKNGDLIRLADVEFKLSM